MAWQVFVVLTAKLWVLSASSANGGRSHSRSHSPCGRRASPRSTRTPSWQASAGHHWWVRTSYPLSLYVRACDFSNVGETVLRLKPRGSSRRKCKVGEVAGASGSFIRQHGTATVRYLRERGDDYGMRDAGHLDVRASSRRGRVVEQFVLELVRQLDFFLLVVDRDVLPGRADCPQRLA